MTKVVDEEFERLIGQGVKCARKRKRVTQNELARRLGITPQQVQKVESGKNRISASRLLQISMILGEPVDSLLKDAREELTGCSDESITSNSIDKDAWRLARHIAEIDDREVRRCFEGLVRSYRRLGDERECARERKLTGHETSFMPDIF